MKSRVGEGARKAAGGVASMKSRGRGCGPPAKQARVVEGVGGCRSRRCCRCLRFQPELLGLPPAALQVASDPVTDGLLLAGLGPVVAGPGCQVVQLHANVILCDRRTFDKILKVIGNVGSASMKTIRDYLHLQSICSAEGVTQST